jgi:hypothetical protein
MIDHSVAQDEQGVLICRRYCTPTLQRLVTVRVGGSGRLGILNCR